MAKNFTCGTKGHWNEQSPTTSMDVDQAVGFLPLLFQVFIGCFNFHSFEVAGFTMVTVTASNRWK